MPDYEQSIFISYAWGGESEAIVNQIDEALQQRGLKIIRDKRDLGYKGSISAFMERIGQGNCIIVVVSDKYLRSQNCMFELVEIAEGKQFYDRVFPIVLSDTDIYDPVSRLGYVKHWETKRSELAQAMKEVDPANLQGIREDMDLYDRIRDKVSSLTSILKDMNTLTLDMHRDSDFSEIYTGIEKRMMGVPSRLEPESGEPPYMGLRYFDISDAQLFYGRETLTCELLARMEKESFLAIVGASGSGKSSVARAGLIPAWKKENEHGAIHVITPTAHPLESLAAGFTRESESVTATSTLMDDMMKDARSLRLYVKKMLGETKLLLLVDQFEETFTLCKDQTERKAFIENLLSLTIDEGKARVVITLRADFYHHCAEYEGLRNALKTHQEYIGAMTADELRQAISMPAEKNGWGFQPGLVDLILSDVGTEPGALPLLSHALLETWRRRQGRTLTLQGYHEAGGVKKAIAKTAESVYGKLTPAEQTIARGIFLRLIELGGDFQDTRRRAKINELLHIVETQDLVAKVLKILTDARLVTTEQDSAEVSHEALIREWGTLRRWLDEDRESLRLYYHLTDSAHEWERRGREASDLYRGTRLTQALAWAKTHTREMSPLEDEYIKACKSEQKREKRAMQFRWASIVGATVVAVVIGGLALTGRLNHFIYRPLPMEFVSVPAGEFMMGSTEKEVSEVLLNCQNCNLNLINPFDEAPKHLVWLDSFQVGKYEVTNEQYYRCVKSGVCSQPLNDKYYSQEYADYPVVDVNWFDANTFCTWNDPNGRLLTEAEWEKAARGSDERIYPWGEVIDCSYANFKYQNEYCVGDVKAVGSYERGKSPYGAYDMAGNVWEWVADQYNPDYYASSPMTNPLAESGDVFVLRGGSWTDEEFYLRSAYRHAGGPQASEGTLGFRCARSP
jgi:formylglycine-generating enzyme required for sulfatase activity